VYFWCGMVSNFPIPTPNSRKRAGPETVCRRRPKRNFAEGSAPCRTSPRLPANPRPISNREPYGTRPGSRPPSGAPRKDGRNSATGGPGPPAARKRGPPPIAAWGAGRQRKKPARSMNRKSLARRQGNRNTDTEQRPISPFSFLVPVPPRPTWGCPGQHIGAGMQPQRTASLPRTHQCPKRCRQRPRRPPGGRGGTDLAKGLSVFKPGRGNAHSPPAIDAPSDPGSQATASPHGPGDRAVSADSPHRRHVPPRTMAMRGTAKTWAPGAS